MIRLASLAALAALVVQLTPAEAKCAMSHLRPEVVSKGAVAADGGIVVATEQARYDEPEEGDATETKWQLEVGGKTSAPKIDVIAPGLAIYRLPAGARSAKLVDAKSKVRAAVTGGAKLDTLPAPRIKSVRHEKNLGRRSSAFTRVVLDSGSPAGAVALVIADPKGKPMSFGLLDAKAEPGSEVTVFSHSRCGVVPNGTIEPNLGDKVTVFWVDSAGRVSPPSKVAVVGGTKPRDDFE